MSLGRKLSATVRSFERTGNSDLISKIDIWFVLPVSMLLRDNEDETLGPEAQNAFDVRYTHFPIIQLTFQDRKLCFYMQFNLQSRSTRIFDNIGDLAVEKFCEVCQQGVQEEEYDPFTFLCSSISELLHSLVAQGVSYTRKIRDIVNRDTCLQSFHDLLIHISARRPKC